MKKYIVVAAVFLLLGMFISKGGSLLKMIPHISFKADTPLRADKVAFLSNFEARTDFKKWDTRAASFRQSTEHATEGKYSGKMVFSGGVKCSNVLMEKYFDGHRSFGNWSGFAEIKFDMYNAGTDTEKVALKIKDTNHKSWVRSLYLHPKEKTEIDISFDEFKNIIDPSRVKQFNFYRWKPANSATFYIDNIRLIPRGKEEVAKEAAIEDVRYVFTQKPAGVEVGIESSVKKVFREPEKFTGKIADTMEISLARNEYEAGQVAIIAHEDINNIKIEKSDLKAVINGVEAKIDKDNVKCYVVGYVNTKQPTYTVSHVGFWPDPLEEKYSFEVKNNTVQPIWVEIYAPTDALAGEYSGDITFVFPDAESKKVMIKANVWNFSLPKETHLKTAFDFYPGRLQNVYPLRKDENKTEYAERLKALEKAYYMDMIKHRIMPIFNFEVTGFFASDIQEYLDNGLSAFAIGKYSGSYGNNWPKDSKKLNELIPIYRDYANILKVANLIDKAYIYTYDDTAYGAPYVNKIAEMVHAADPDLKNMIGLQYLAEPERYPGWDKDIDILCIRNVLFNEKMVEAHKANGKEIWTFVSGPEPPYPTLVIDFPAMAYRIVPWQCWKYGIKGYLYWCVNFWTKDPWKDPANTKWGQNGNGLLYYPGENGPIASIRLKVTRDGIEDYEYLYLLDSLLKKTGGKNKDLLVVDESIAASMADYIKDPDVIYKRRKDIAETIVALKGPSQPVKTVEKNADLRIPLTVVSLQKEAPGNWPVSGGIPFPQNSVRNLSNIKVVDEKNAAIPFQARILGQWPDKSIKWLQLDIKTPLNKELYLVSSNDTSWVTGSPLRTEETDKEVLVTTGPLKFSVSKESFNLFSSAWLDANSDGIFSENELISRAGDMTIKHKGETYKSSLDRDTYELVTEEAGPVKVGLKATGWFTSEKGKKFCKFITRIQAFSGESFVRVYHTFIYTGYPENKYNGKYRDLKMPENETIQEIGITLPYNLSEGKSCAFGSDNKAFKFALANSIDLMQEKHDAFHLKTESGQVVTRGERASGWIDLFDNERGISVAIRDFWQQYPKAFSVSKRGNVILAKLWPEEAGALDLKTEKGAYGPEAIARGSAFGLAKTHELLFYFHKGGPTEAKSEIIARQFNESPVLSVYNGWVCDSAIFGGLLPYDNKLFYGEEAMLSDLFTWAIRQPTDFKWYGMLDYGDVLTWFREENGELGWHPEGRWGWYNSEGVGLGYGAIIQFIRTQDKTYFDFAERNIKHVMDVDTCHYNTVKNDPRLRNLINDEFSQPGSMHRHNYNHWGGRNDEASHTNLAQILMYYYLTGYERAFDVAKEVGEYFLKEPITYTGHPDLAPSRAIANVLWGEVMMFEATGDERYKKEADKWARIFVDGQREDGAWPEHYNPITGEWAGGPHPIYTPQYLLPALVSYHRLTGDAKTANAIIKGVDFLVANDPGYPFFDSLSYAYWLTKDRQYVEKGVGMLSYTITEQERSDDPTLNGMIHSKRIYHRPSMYLWNVPYIFKPIKENGVKASHE